MGTLYFLLSFTMNLKWFFKKKKIYLWKKENSKPKKVFTEQLKRSIHLTNSLVYIQQIKNIYWNIVLGILWRRYKQVDKAPSHKEFEI